MKTKDNVCFLPDGTKILTIQNGNVYINWETKLDNFGRKIDGFDAIDSDFIDLFDELLEKEIQKRFEDKAYVWDKNRGWLLLGEYSARLFTIAS